MEDSKLENVLRKSAIGVGIVLLFASMYLSYDGFDQSVSGDNPNYSLLAMAIGIALAIAFSLLEFIVSSRNENLNTTLRWLGLFAYAYSIYTNFLGAQHLLQMDRVMAIIVAVVMDVFPEQMIAWGLGEAVMHDIFGNLGKFASAPMKKSGGKGGGQGNQGNQGKPQSNNHGGQPQFQKQGGQNYKGNGGGNGGGSGGNSHRPLQMTEEMRRKVMANFSENRPTFRINKEDQGDSDKFS